MFKVCHLKYLQRLAELYEKTDPIIIAYMKLLRNQRIKTYRVTEDCWHLYKQLSAQRSGRIKRIPGIFVPFREL